MGKTAPSYVLVAQDNEDDKDKQIAKLKAALEDEEKKAKSATEDKEDLEAKLKANLDEDKIEGAKKALLKAQDDEKDEDMKAKIASVLKSMEVFNTQDKKPAVAEVTEKDKTTIVASLEAKFEELSSQILAANKLKKEESGIGFNGEGSGNLQGSVINIDKMVQEATLQ